MKLTYLKKGWKRPYVYRSEIEKFSRGIIGPGYLSNLDSIGAGPKRMKLGGKVVYDVNDFIKWLEKRSEVVS